MTQDYQAVGNVPIGPYNAAIDKDVDQVERQAVGIDIGPVNSGVWTPSRVSSTNPFPVTPVSSGSNVTTWTNTLVNASSGTLLAANTNRKRFTICHDSSSTKIYVKFGSGASSSDYNIILYGQSAYVSDLYEYAGLITFASSSGVLTVLVGEGV
jgi:hypothetical protein